MAQDDGKTEMRQDTVVTWNWFRLNVPTIIAIAGVGLYINNGLRDAIKSTDDLKGSIDRVQTIIEPVPNITYRLQRAEENITAANTRIDNLSNTMINNIDLIRRDVNRLTTQVEVMSTRLQTYMVDYPDEPKQRRSRPGGPIEP